MYINATFLIISIGAISLYDLPDQDICKLPWLIFTKIPSFLDLNLGVCQASILTQLIIKLRQLFGLKNDTDSLRSSGVEVIQLEHKRISTTHKRIAIIRGITVFINVGLLIACGYVIYYQYHERNLFKHCTSKKIQENY